MTSDEMPYTGDYSSLVTCYSNYSSFELLQPETRSAQHANIGEH